MQFGHEQLDVYRLAINYVAWSYAVAKERNGVDRHARDQLLRAAQSIALDIAEGNGKGRMPTGVASARLRVVQPWSAPPFRIVSRRVRC